MLGCGLLDCLSERWYFELESRCSVLAAAKQHLLDWPRQRKSLKTHLGRGYSMSYFGISFRGFLHKDTLAISWSNIAKGAPHITDLERECGMLLQCFHGRHHLSQSFFAQMLLSPTLSSSEHILRLLFHLDGSRPSIKCWFQSLI